MPKISLNIEIGLRIGRLIILEDLGRVNRRRMVVCKCDCGAEKVINWDALNSGRTLSCGCLHKDELSKRFKKHGLTDHPIRSVWRNMIKRCYDPSSSAYKDYGAAGVTMCDEWHYSLVNFYNWCISQGWTDELQVDKDIIPKAIGFDGKLYCPEFCCLVTSTENARNTKRNRMIEYDGNTLCLSEWAEKYDIKYSVFLKRLKIGWSMDKIINTPVKENK